jgi:FAD/FMN-containing dehydrogenase
VDLPRDGERQDRLLASLDQVVVEGGGRVYLAKDARLSAASFHAMYPELPTWLEVKRRVDPERRFTSSLSRRLGLDG